MSIDMSTDLLAQPRAVFGGAVFLSGEPGRDEARASWQLSVNEYPASVAYPESEQDIVEIVQAGRELELRADPPPGGRP